MNEEWKAVSINIIFDVLDRTLYVHLVIKMKKFATQ